MIELRLLPLPHFAGLQPPAYQTEGSAGLDVRAAVPEDAPVVLGPGERRLIPTGLTMALPPGFECQIRPRSGLALKHGLTCLNTPGTIDSDYRGEVQVLLVNLGAKPFTIRRGERIAQMVVARYERVEPMLVSSLEETGRGAGGFGSTGVSG